VFFYFFLLQFFAIVVNLYPLRNWLKFFIFCDNESVFRMTTKPFFCDLNIQTRHTVQQQRVEAGSDWSLRAEQKAFGSLKQVIALTKPQA